MIDLLVATIDHCFGVPGLFRIGERHNLEVPPLDLYRPLSNPAGLPASAGFQLLTHFSLSVGCLLKYFCYLFM